MLAFMRRNDFCSPNEQHPIVARVDELMALYDRLEAQLTTAQTQSRRLLEAALHQALTTQLTAS
jgi:hypothetical protein